MTEPTAAAALEAIYASLPRVPCQQKCQAGCGPIDCSDLEWERMNRALPLIATGRFNRHTMTCGFLNEVTGLCQIYDVRPLVCRLWGVVEAMRCPWGCEPDRWLSDDEAVAIFEKLWALSPRLVTHAPPEALAMVRKYLRSTRG